MRLKNYLNEEKNKVAIKGNEIFFPDYGSVEIPSGKELILIGSNKKASIDMIGVSRGNRNNKILTMKGKDMDWWDSSKKLEDYLNKFGYTEFKGYNRF